MFAIAACVWCLHSMSCAHPRSSPIIVSLNSVLTRVKWTRRKYLGKVGFASKHKNCHATEKLHLTLRGLLLLLSIILLRWLRAPRAYLFLRSKNGDGTVSDFKNLLFFMSCYGKLLSSEVFDGLVVKNDYLIMSQSWRRYSLNLCSGALLPPKLQSVFSHCSVLGLCSLTNRDLNIKQGGSILCFLIVQRKKDLLVSFPFFLNSMFISFPLLLCQFPSSDCLTALSLFNVVRDFLKFIEGLYLKIKKTNHRIV